MSSIKKPRMRKVSYTLADSFATLCRIQEQALSAEPKPDFGAALKTEELKGKLVGLYADMKQGSIADIPQILVEFIPNDSQNGTNTGGVQTADDNEETH